MPSLAGRELQRNAVTEIEVGNKARREPHQAPARRPGRTFHLVTWLVELGQDAQLPGVSSFPPAPSLSRSQIYAAFAGEGSSLDISGALLIRGHQHCDTTLLVEHRVPRCTSRELFKAVLDNEARGVFQGKIIVSPGAQKTDGKQMAQALLLSETASSTPSRSLRSSPTTWCAAMARPRPDRRGSAVLPAIPRHSGGRGPRAADPGLCRRGDRARSSMRAYARHCPGRRPTGSASASTDGG